MDNQQVVKPEKKGRDLKDEEKVEMREGQQLYEMVQSAGWKIVRRWLDDRAYHSWVDPRTIEGAEAEKEWKWRELNAFHSADVAKQIMDDIQRMVDRADYLGKVASGETIEAQRMKI